MLRRVRQTTGWPGFTAMMSSALLAIVAAAQDPAPQPEPTADRFAVPEGDVNELLQFMEGWAAMARSSRPRLVAKS